MIRDRQFGILRYTHAVWDGRPPLRVVAATYEEAVERVCGKGLTLVACARIRSLYRLVAKVWDGHGFRYCYDFPAGAGPWIQLVETPPSQKNQQAISVWQTELGSVA